MKPTSTFRDLSLLFLFCFFLSHSFGGHGSPRSPWALESDWVPIVALLFTSHVTGKISEPLHASVFFLISKVGLLLVYTLHGIVIRVK